MLLIHANYLDENFQLVQGDLEIQEGKILRVGKDLPRKEEDLAVDCGGEYTIVPGFVDVHIHGCAGADACDGTRESLEKGTDVASQNIPAEMRFALKTL